MNRGMIHLRALAMQTSQREAVRAGEVQHSEHTWRLGSNHEHGAVGRLQLCLGVGGLTESH